MCQINEGLTTTYRNKGTINHLIAQVLKTKRYRVIGLVVLLFYKMCKIVFSIGHCTREGENSFVESRVCGSICYPGLIRKKRV